MALTTARAALAWIARTTHRSGWPLQPSQLDAAPGGVVPWRVLDPALLKGEPNSEPSFLLSEDSSQSQALRRAGSVTGRGLSAVVSRRPDTCRRDRRPRESTPGLRRDGRLKLCIVGEEGTTIDAEICVSAVTLAVSMGKTKMRPISTREPPRPKSPETSSPD
jgi:hypothetical protein